MSVVAIIGDGTVGKALGLNINVTPLGPGETKVKADVVIICVPTPTVDGRQDLSNIRQALKRLVEPKLVILRSTVLPGTTNKLQKQCKWPILFVPEWGFEATMTRDLAQPLFYVFGYTTRSNNLHYWILAQDVLPAANQYRQVEATVAEFSKYFANIWGASQVTLANSFYDWVIKLTGQKRIYEQAITLTQQHPNVPKWGWQIFDQGYRGYGGKCLPKDTQAAISQYPHELWQLFEKINESLSHDDSLL
jgi:UDPglucose 6-dehydrogenase